MANYLEDNDDLLFYLDKGIDWGPLVEITERGLRDEDGPKSVGEAVELYRDIATMVGKFAAEEVAPRAKAIETAGVVVVDGEAVGAPELDELFERIRELDLHRLNVPRELDGMNCPLLLYFVVCELMARADVSVMAHHGFHGGMALAMLIFSIREGSTTFENHRIVETRFAEEIEEILSGRAWGCMDITEPDAGSDMARLRTVGEQDADGNWFVTGQKIFITSGHGKYHFVIARTEKPGDGSDPMAGLDGLSMFLVPAYTEDEHGNRTRIVTLDRAEEKLGHHGSCTAALTFDRAPAHLLGKRGEGFKYMLQLMNNARLGVGFESIGLCEAAYRLARDYAAERPSMGKTIDQHEMIADYLDQMRTEIQGLRALAMYGGFHEEMAAKLDIAIQIEPERRREFERLQRRHKSASRRVTPLIKYLAAEKAVEMARRSVQIHGGNGYTTEYGAEKLLRDAMVMPIYEGTSQIQALMAMKDTLGGIIKAPQEFVKRLAQARWRALSARDAHERRVAKLQVLGLDAQQHLMRRTATDKLRAVQDRPLTEWPQAFLKDWDPKRDFSYAMLHAEHLTQLLADVAICEVLLEQAHAHPERIEVLERYLERAEPRARHQYDLIVNTGQGLLERLALRTRERDDSARAAQ
ncbi:acyl-CoA dehydrogenase family protein [Paraliomyxa miuraensis]|uniref:acyl-CoA dehydrogenase family protein n=1 Tax=Paraliomyxa miuraensis TaxID=376150 RepID=UPI002255A431|nr:acyl-CoA dehydrogenase family protein [Paraliomyxa miuraensis]MCX4246944.1 acyl-CoA dehydrogenase family protein [Paraliomyxa miuraensis]